MHELRITKSNEFAPPCSLVSLFSPRLGWLYTSKSSVTSLHLPSFIFSYIGVRGEGRGQGWRSGESTHH